MDAIDELIERCAAPSTRMRAADENGRSRSWEHCYRVFRDARGRTHPLDYDYLSLHLAFIPGELGDVSGLVLPA